ncbi:hypothetical protein [Halobacillus sp. B29]|uniref:hypothetical protein n=1 Tax=Halobacillus sp. B29 TaxID=3457432 RepID=UPI003FCE29E7
MSSKKRIAFSSQRKSLMETEEDIEDLTEQLKRLECKIRDVKDPKGQAEGNCLITDSQGVVNTNSE